MTNAKLIKELDKRLKAVGKERDRLDNLIGDAEHLRENCEQAWDCLQDARDALSEMV